MARDKEKQIWVFNPDYIVSPGEILKDDLEAIGMTRVDLSEKTSLAKKTINEIIKGKATLTPSTAILLSRIVGRSEMFWLNLEAIYQTALIKEKRIRRKLRASCPKSVHFVL